MDQSQLRIGLGHDTHRLVDGGPLVVGGISIEHSKHADGHSDADVLLHAITDAVLGAACLGDIGELFPNTDPDNRDRDSADMLKVAWQKVCDNGFRLINLDCVVLLQRPKMSPHKNKIRLRIAEILSAELDQIGLKAKTGEGVDAVGNELAITAQCVALLVKGPTK